MAQKNTLLFICSTLLFYIFLSSCTNEVTLQFDNSDIFNINTAYTESVTVVGRHFKAERTAENLTQQGRNIVIGHYVDDKEHGTLDIASVLRLSIPSTAFSGTDLVVDSAVLVLRNTNNFVGDSLNSKYKINVRILDEKFSQLNTYNSDYNYKIKPTIYGSVTKERLRLTDSIQINQFTSSQVYTTTKVPSEIRIPIDNQYILDNLVNAPDYVFRNNNTFREYFNGFYIDIDADASSGEGGILFFNTSESELQVYYRALTGTANHSTTYTTLGINSASSYLKSAYDYTGTEVESTLETRVIHDKIYVQPFSGLDVELELGNYDFLRGNNVAINRVELKLYPLDITDLETLTIPTNLSLYYFDEALQRRNIVDHSTPNNNDERSIGAAYGGVYNAEDMSYTFIITGFFEDVVQQKYQNNKLYLTTNDGENNSSIYSSFSSGRRVIFSNVGEKAIQILVYYTTLQ